MDTTIFSHINWLAVLAGGAAYFLLGAVWYSLLFSKAWIRSSGINVNDPKMKSGMAQTMLFSFLLMVIASTGLAMMIYKIGTYTWMTGAKVGLVAGVCFSATAISISYLYEKKPCALHMINGAYNIAGCIIAGIIISVWPK